MNAVVQSIEGELIDDCAQFFAPMASDLVDSLIGEYGAMRKRISALAEAVGAEQCVGALHHFIEGNLRDQRHGLPTTIGRLFDLAGAVAHLNASYWTRALRLTDVLDYMPQKRRDEWFEQINNPLGRQAVKHTNVKPLPPLPEFEESTVRATLADLLNNRAKFFAERVDGIFRSLSKEHVTNCPQGFNKRMIIPRAISSYGTIEHSTSGVINDLRCVIAKFMGRDEPKYCATDAVIRAARKHNGEWTTIDGGALRIRIYNGVGTAHLEVHPDMAWRLNSVLASLYPLAIPAEFRTKPKRARKIKDFELFDRPLPFAVIDLLAGLRDVRRKIRDVWPEAYEEIRNARVFSFGDRDKAAVVEAEKVLAAIGGVQVSHYWQFDYNPDSVLDEIVCSGHIPDHKSHQFYPTPASLAEKVIELAQIGDTDTCLEPSAGQGGLADLMPKERTLCVEVSPLHSQILEAKGHQVITADFLQWKRRPDLNPTRICMNPPFSEGRWQAHLEHAAGMLAQGGRLVAVLPASAKSKALLPGFDLTWSKTYENEFAGTSANVVILLAKRAK